MKTTNITAAEVKALGIKVGRKDSVRREQDGRIIVSVWADNTDRVYNSEGKLITVWTR